MKQIFVFISLSLFLTVNSVLCESDQEGSSSPAPPPAGGSHQDDPDQVKMDQAMTGWWRRSLMIRASEKNKFKDMLRAMDFSDDNIESYDKDVSHGDIRIQKTEENKYGFLTTHPNGEKRIDFAPGVEYEDELFDGRKFKSTFTFEPKKLKMIKEEKHEGFECRHEFKFDKDLFSGRTLKVKYMCNGKRATIDYNLFNFLPMLDKDVEDDDDNNDDDNLSTTPSGDEQEATTERVEASSGSPN